MMKKSVTLILIIMAVMCSASVVYADAYITLNGFSFYKNADAEAVIVGYDGTDSAVTIPPFILGAQVTEIAPNAFFRDSVMQSVSFSAAVNLQTIGSNAFFGCEGLSAVTLPALDTLGFGAFQSCQQLQSLTIENGLTAVPGQAFYDCTALETVTLPASVTSIGDYAFGKCVSLRELTLPYGVTQISPSAFWGCNALTLHCYRGSYAAAYAQQYGIPFRNIDAVLLGDPTDDQYVNVHDVTAIQRYLAELKVLQGALLFASDVTQDGTTDITDATTLQSFLAEFEVGYPIGEQVEYLS